MSRFTDWLADAVGRVAQDVRQRVVERGWFGEAVTPRAQSITLGMLDRSAGEQSPAERMGWASPASQTERAAEPGWFARHFSPDPSREHRPGDRPGRSREQERGIER